MLILIGGTGFRKRAIAQHMARNRKVISAGDWVRSKVGRFHHTDKGDCFCWRCQGLYEAPDMVKYSMEYLEKNPDCIIEYIRSEMEGLNREDVIVEGFRNPRDFFHFVQPFDHILDVGGLGTSEFESSGLRAIRASKDFLETLHVTWSEHKSNFARCPEPIPCALPKDFLNPGENTGIVSGHILAFESYSGLPITVLWQSVSGGQYHDVPLNQIIFPETAPLDPLDFREYIRSQTCVSGSHSYGCADVGSPVFDWTPNRDVSVFDRDRSHLGFGVSLGIVHWPQGNTLFHVVNFEGRLLLWPPHKLLFSTVERTLPDWSKNRTVGVPE